MHIDKISHLVAPPHELRAAIRAEPAISRAARSTRHLENRTGLAERKTLLHQRYHGGVAGTGQLLAIPAMTAKHGRIGLFA